MRLGAFCIAILALISPAALEAQEYSGSSTRAPGRVLRPAATVAWRNYVTVPDGPCGCPMSVQADCYNDCPHRCNPIRFVRRVGRMLDCLLPCNLCCGQGLHGCHLGGRTWGHCGICCGTACGGDCGGGCGRDTRGHGGCCTNPAGSVFDDVASSGTSGGHCFGCSNTVGGGTVGCSTTVPMLSDPFQDDPLPPKPTTQPARPVAKRQEPVARSQGTGDRRQETLVKAQPPVASQAVRSSPYKIVEAPAAKTNVSRPANRPSSSKVAPAVNVDRGGATQSVLRRASAEEVEPEPLNVDHARAVPLSRAHLREVADYYATPSNPLR